MQGVNMKGSYQEDLLKWVEGPEGTCHNTKEIQEERRKWTKMQVNQLREEVRECTLPELEGLCRKKGILIWSIKYYSPNFYRDVIENTRKCAMQEIIEELGMRECFPPQLKTLLREINEIYDLNKHHGEISSDDLQEYDPTWFHMAFKNRYVTLSDMIDQKSSPPRFQRVLDE
jgi:hypothetical protein